MQDGVTIRFTRFTRAALLERFHDGQSRYRHDFVFHSVIDALHHGQDPLVVIDELLTLNQGLRKELERRTLEPQGLASGPTIP